jgi:LPS-assembly lipoprotein
MKHKKYYILFLLICFIAGCGFHLRGNFKLPPNLQQLYIASDSPYGPVTIQLKQILGHSGVQLEDQPGPGIITLDVKNQRYKQSTFSQSASAKTTQYTLYFNLDYDLQDNKGVTLYGPKTVGVQGNYTVNQDAVLTTSTQEDTLRTELQRQAVYQLIEQLNSPNVANAVKTMPKGTNAATSTVKTTPKSTNEN